jgi:hypothetical protein
MTPAGSASDEIAAQIPMARARSAAAGYAARDDRERAREQERGAHPLHDAPADEQRRAGREAGCQRARAEGGEPGEDDALVAVAIAEVAAREHQRGQGDRIAVDDPLQAAHAGAEVGAHGGQRDVDRRHVEQDEEHADAHHDEGHRGSNVGLPPSTWGRTDVRPLDEGAARGGHDSTVGRRGFVSGRSVARLPS